MRSILIRYILFVPILFHFTSCTSQQFYTPNRANVSLFTKKNELRISASESKTSKHDYNNNESFSGESIQVSYSISDQIAVMSNYFRTSNTTVKRGYFDIGAGYYKKLNDDERFHVVFESYAGLGLASTRGFDFQDADLKLADVRYSKLFLQPSFGIRTSFFRTYVAANISRLNLYSMQSHSSYDEYDWAWDEYNYLLENRKSTLVEVAWGLELGYKYVWLRTGITSSENLTASDLIFTHSYMNLGLSIVLPIDEIWKLE